MVPLLSERWGNPSSTYGFGAKLRGDIEHAREAVAALVNGRPSEVVFTASGTEANNMAILSALAARPARKHIVTTAVEHSSVLAMVEALEARGYNVTRLQVDRDGLLDIAELDDAITEETGLVSVMWANNETGVLFPVEQAAGLCHDRGVSFHCDAVQAVGKTAIDVRRVPISYLTISGHKIHGPKGCGAMWVRRGAHCEPLIRGGHQERGRRGGTENVAGIVGLGVAAEEAARGLAAFGATVQPMRDYLEESIVEAVPHAERNGSPDKRLPNITNLAFPGLSSEALVLLLEREGVCVSAGSACLAASGEPSHVIRAMKPEYAGCSLRFSLDVSNTREDVQTAAMAVGRASRELYSTAP